MLQTQGIMMKKWSSGVDTGSSSVDTSPSSQRTQLTGLYCVSTLDPVPIRPVWQFWTASHDRASQDYYGKRRFERERGICIQRSRAALPKGEEGEEEGEEEEELEIATVLIQKEIQPSLCMQILSWWCRHTLYWCRHNASNPRQNDEKMFLHIYTNLALIPTVMDHVIQIR
ncbi:hypothetical protein Taro_031345, partial [Colocasia esculenta]|nr:hypothetical protein [Colocasia esculenta]